MPITSNIYRDGRNPARAQDPKVAASTTVHYRKIRLFISDSDNQCFAEISNGNPGDEVWIDRSFDGGSTWECDKLGLTTIPFGSRKASTLLYNIDNSNSRNLGLVRACGKAGDRNEIELTPWVRSTVNFREAGLVQVHCRQVRLFISDEHDMGFAEISNGCGESRDEVWIDRSIDGGISWKSGSRLGLSIIPETVKGENESREVRTPLFKIDNRDSREIGALRACGKAGNRREIECTPWVRSGRNCGSPVEATATALMQFYDRKLFPTTGWW